MVESSRRAGFTQCIGGSRANPTTECDLLDRHRALQNRVKPSPDNRKPAVTKLLTQLEPATNQRAIDTRGVFWHDERALAVIDIQRHPVNFSLRRSLPAGFFAILSAGCAVPPCYPT